MSRLRDTFESPFVYVPASVAVWVAAWVAIELLLFDGDLFTGVIAGGAGGLAFGLMTYVCRRAR